MTSYSLDLIQSAFDDLVELPREQCQARLDSIAKRDPELHAQLQSLLDAHYSLTGPLDTPPSFHLTGINTVEGTSTYHEGDRIGPYQLDRLIGEGGMGSVWLAERVDGQLERRVALKLPRWSWVLPELRTRLARERDILAGLEHANIARLYDAGVDTLGRPYLAMEYVKGENIDRYCEARHLDVAERIRLVLQVASAVAFAHSRLVVHRDLKPSNVLVSDDGTVRLLDFGIAKLLQDESAPDTGLTQQGTRAFTLDYAAPEQLKGDAVGTPTDVYALARVLFQLLTGTSPYRTSRPSAAALEEAIIAGETILASSACTDSATAAQLRGDIDAILNKALKKDPANRYTTIDAFADDLRRHLAYEPVLARPDSRSYRFRKYARRHRVGLGAAIAVALTLATATIVSVWQARLAEREAIKATAIKEFLVQLFTDADGREIQISEPQNLKVIDVMDRGRARLLGALTDQPEVQLELIDVLGDVYELIDATDKSLGLYRMALPIADQYFGSNSAQRAHFLAEIANTLSIAGDIQRLRPALDEAGKAFAMRGDHQSLDYAHFLKLKGRLRRMDGKAGFADAARILAEAARLFSTYYPAEEDHAASLMFLAQAQMSLDEPAEALQAANAAVAAIRYMPNDTVSRANTLSVRATIYDQVGDFTHSQSDYLLASADYRKALGNSHFLYLQNENLRGASLQMLGMHVDGLQLLETTTAEIAKVRNGSNTHMTTLLHLADAYLRDGSYQRAADTAAQGVAIGRVRATPALLSALLLCEARARRGLGDFPVATRLVSESIDIARTTATIADALVADAAILSADIALAKKDFSEAKKQVLIARGASAGAGYSNRVRRVRIALIESQLASGAELQFTMTQRAVSDATSLPSPGNAFLRIAALEQLGDILCANGALEKAREALATATTLRAGFQSPHGKVTTRTGNGSFVCLPAPRTK